MSTVLRHFWEKYGGVVLIVIVSILIIIVAYRVGQLQKETENAAKINIFLVNKEKVIPVDQRARAIDEALQRKGLENKIEKVASKDVDEPKNCLFVASKNSKVYHLPSCKNVTRIKDNNKLCFSSLEEVKATSREEAKCCHK
ncbi:hypothetical protein HN784_00320 [bacterium]|nr:hypothetical protein [bacterium]MBT4251411.1 hypothetical protein [bacterium]MBT6754362.1 hypothetical protein [bacterium]MBT7037285.1 hypothetical protein [bacterium]MBT7431280.1 hypothetical protein [bacterium]